MNGPQAVSLVVAMVALAAVVLDSAFMWPQAVKLARTGDIAGVSALTWLFAVVFSAAWAAYAAAIGMWPLFASNVSCTVAGAVAVGFGVRAGWPRRYVAWAAGATSGVVALTAVFPTATVVLLSVGAVAFVVPQFVALLRAASVTGVAALTWWLNVVVSACWLVVAVYEQAAGVAVANTASIAALAVTLVLLYYRRFGGRPLLR